jgi:hypothetical protein
MRSLFSPAREQYYVGMGRFTRFALAITVASFFWAGFKIIEPIIFPVVKHFAITSAHLSGPDQIEISGHFDKVRGCEFVELVGYSGGTFVGISLGNRPSVTRMTRLQTYGPWTLTPKINHLELYSRHLCATGKVVTKLFDGAIVL